MMNDKSWSFFGLTVFLCILGFSAGISNQDDVAAACCAGGFLSAGLTWIMTTY